MQQQSVLTRFKQQLLTTSAGMLFPSESDEPFFWFESTLTALPAASNFAQKVGHKGEKAERLEPSAFFGKYTRLEPWMDSGQQSFALKMQKLQQVYAQASTKLAVYRIGTVQVHIYMVAVVSGRVVGLQTLSIET